MLFAWLSTPVVTVESVATFFEAVAVFVVPLVFLVDILRFYLFNFNN